MRNVVLTTWNGVASDHDDLSCNPRLLGEYEAARSHPRRDEQDADTSNLLYVKYNSS